MEQASGVHKAPRAFWIPEQS